MTDAGDRAGAAGPLARLAAMAQEIGHGTLSPEAARATRFAVLDWFATTLPGCRDETARQIAGAVAPWAGRDGRAVCYVSSRLLDPRSAALVNGTASHVVEFDDIFRDGGYHPGSPTVAAALALAQDQGSGVDAFHRAVAAGYEIGCRISLAIQPSHYRFWHTTATVGTMGAAVAGAVLLGGDAAAIARALSLATSFAGGHQQNLQGQGTAKSLHIGHAAEAGLLAAAAALRGLSGSPDALDGKTGFAAATSESAGDWEAAFDPLGGKLAIEQMTVKAHGCCGHVFPALDAITALEAQGDWGPEDVATLHVAGYGATKIMCDRPDPKNAQDARFSLQYCLAARLLMGRVRLDAFSNLALARADIRALMPLITVSQDPEIAAAYPRRRMARVTLVLKDGRRFDHFQTTRRGDPEDPLSEAERIAKFDELAGVALEVGEAETLKRTVLEGAALPGLLPLRRD